MKLIQRILGFCCVLFLLTGCFDHERGASHTAISFFDALYIDRDLDRAISLSGEQMAEVLEHYGDVDLVQEHLLGLTFDSAEQISTLHRRTLTLREHRNKVDVTIFLSGYINGYQYSEDRKVRVRRSGDRWLIESFLT